MANERTVIDLTLDNFLQRVLDNNESVQMRVLDLAISRKIYKGTRGIFEPELVGSLERQVNSRENTAEQVSSLGVATFEEDNNIYNGGLESFIPTGGRIRLGYTLRDLFNNLGRSTNFFNSTRFDTNQYQAFLGFSITQPILKNFGPKATLAEMRLAALASEEAFHEYRKQLMLVLSTAEAAYWNLYMAQEQMLFLRESVDLAETILKDNHARQQAGKGAELEVLEAEAGLGVRRAKQNEAWLNYYEAINRMAALYGGSAMETNHLVIAVDSPGAKEVAVDYFASWRNAFDLNPDYQIQRHKVMGEHIRLAYAQNQRWPQLDLKASYGLNGLGETPRDTWRDIEQTSFPSWSIGMEMRIPLTGGIKSRNDLDAAKLRQKRAILGLKEVETQINNGLDTAIKKAQIALDSVRNYDTAVRFNQTLLSSQLARLDLGKVESRKVLEVEGDLFSAKNAVLEAKVLYQRALLELALIEGSVLKSRNLDLSKRDLENKTALLVVEGKMTDAQYEQFLKELRWQLHQNRPLDQPTEAQARQVLQREMERLPAPRGASGIPLPPSTQPAVPPP